MVLSWAGTCLHGAILCFRGSLIVLVWNVTEGPYPFRGAFMDRSTNFTSTSMEIFYGSPIWDLGDFTDFSLEHINESTMKAPSVNTTFVAPVEAQSPTIVGFPSSHSHSQSVPDPFLGLNRCILV